MPLKHGKSKKVFGENVAKERKDGKKESQALAIAYSMKRDSDDKRGKRKDKK